MALVRFQAHRDGIRDLLAAPGVLADLTARGERVAEAARTIYTAKPPHQGQVEVTVSAETVPDRRVRSRVVVYADHPGALPIEADRRPLGSALSAGG